MKLPLLKQQQGITLLETLAIVVIGAIILISGTTILTTSSSKHNKQATNTVQLSEISYVLKQITKDMRMSTKIEKSGSNTVILSKDTTIIATYSFNETTHTVTRNNIELGSNIQAFDVEILSPKVLITIKALNEKEVHTELLLRSGL